MKRLLTDASFDTIVNMALSIIYNLDATPFLYFKEIVNISYFKFAS